MLERGIWIEIVGKDSLEPKDHLLLKIGTVQWISAS